MEIRFQKMHGTMNDFVVFADLEDKTNLVPEQVAAICKRRAGVGSDGLIAVRSSSKAHFFMDYLNSDGSLAEMCGNGIRCLAKYVYDNGLIDQNVIEVETRAGVKTVEVFPAKDGKVETVRVDMGQPIFRAEDIPVHIQSSGSPIIDHPIEANGETFLATIVSMGNPHCVIFPEGPVDELPVRFGPILENHPLFPARTNVEFIRVDGPERLTMRVWERGSGETLACGTGACASVVAARLKGLVGPDCTVGLLGGDLSIKWEGQGSSVLMTGSAITVYEGILTI